MHAGNGALAWPEWTDLKFQGHYPNLMLQTDEVQNVARAAIDSMIHDVLFNEAYPHEADRLTTSCQNMKIIAHNLGYDIIAEHIDVPHEQNYFKSLYGIVHGISISLQNDRHYHCSQTSI
jgi:hypothetical protein